MRLVEIATFFLSQHHGKKLFLAHAYQGDLEMSILSDLKLILKYK